MLQLLFHQGLNGFLGVRKNARSHLRHVVFSLFSLLLLSMQWGAAMAANPTPTTAIVPDVPTTLPTALPTVQQGK
jgi:hypothetical protein